MGSQQALMAPLPSGINLDDIQGDILLGGFPKRAEVYCFFKINDVKEFASRLKQVHFTSASDIMADRLRLPKPGFRSSDFLFPVVGQNIAFTCRGLDKLRAVKPGTLKMTDVKSAAPAFSNGMSSKAERDALEDPNWNDQKFSSPDLDGVLKVGGSDQDICEEALASTLFALGAKADKPVMAELGREIGRARDGVNKGHEHFGFEDGISQPQITGVDDQSALSDPDSKVTNLQNNFVAPGVILVGRDGDSGKPAWMKDGSFLVFRKLRQDVKVWDKFILDNMKAAGFDNEPKKYAAMLMGRWQSGCPLDNSKKDGRGKENDDPDQAFKNDFDFNNSKCPASAHIRKSNIRQGFDSSRIMRRGITYGEDFAKNNPKDSGDRGLLFACYQSSIENGYRFIQQSWANNENFPGGGQGLDVVFGQKKAGGADIKTQGIAFKGVNQFVQMQGGEYFFAPSIKAIRESIAA